MKGITDFISTASTELDVPEDQTRQATGALLSTLKSRLETGDFKELLGALPGADNLLNATPAAAPAVVSAGAPAGLSGGLGGMASALGGTSGAGGMLGLAAMIQKTGLAPAKIGGLVQAFVQFVKGRAGEGLMKKLFAQVPEMAALAA